MTKLALLRVTLIVFLVVGFVEVHTGVMPTTESSILDRPFSEDQIEYASNENIVATGHLTIGPCNAIFVEGNLAFIGNGRHLEILNITNPELPIHISSVFLGYIVEGICVEGDYAYIACRLGGLLIVDIEDISSPRRISRFETPAWAIGVFVDSDIAYVSISYRGIVLVDVNNPFSPTEISQCDTSGKVTDAILIGNYVYASNQYGGILVFDVSSKENPEEVVQYDTVGSALGIAYAENHIYLASGYDGFHVVNVANPLVPTYVGHYSTTEYASDIEIVEGTVFVSEGDPDEGQGALSTFNAIDPHSVFLLGRCELSGPGYDVAVNGDNAFIPVSERGLCIVDTGNLQNPSEVVNYPTAGSARGISVNGDYAYIAENLAGLQVVNISNRKNPVVVGNYLTSSHAEDVFVIDNFAYLADRNNGLWILNVSNPTNITLLGHCKTSEYTYDVCIRQGFAYLACGGDGLRIVNIGNPTSPYEVGSYGQFMDITKLDVVDDYVYLIHSGGLTVVDTSNPSDPIRCSGITISGEKTGLSVKDNIAVVSIASFGIKIYDVSIPADPKLIGESQIAGYIRGSYINGDLLFVTADGNGLRILDIRNSANINEVGSYITNGLSTDVLYQEGYIYMIEIDCGFWIFEHDCDEDDLFSRLEYEHGTPPFNPDADHDSLSDGLEILVYFTDPFNPDSDFDLIPDDWEVQNGLNPLVDDSAQDDDMDGLSALEEYLAGTSIFTNDTDSDSLSDSAELLIYGTNPLNSDSDFDHMPDEWEVQFSLNPLVDDSQSDFDLDNLFNLLEYQIGTNPTLVDSDMDGYSDSWEYNNGFDPLDPNVGLTQYFVSGMGWFGLILLLFMIPVAAICVIFQYKHSGSYEDYPYNGTSPRRYLCPA